MVLGHLAICAEHGQRHLGGKLTHPSWVERFGTGSPDAVGHDDTLALRGLSQVVRNAYQGLQESALAAPYELLVGPHGVKGLDGTPIIAVADAIATLLTNHFGFHWSQLSTCRRLAGLSHLH